MAVVAFLSTNALGTALDSTCGFRYLSERRAAISALSAAASDSLLSGNDDELCAFDSGEVESVRDEVDEVAIDDEDKSTLDGY